MYGVSRKVRASWHKKHGEGGCLKYFTYPDTDERGICFPEHKDGDLFTISFQTPAICGFDALEARIGSRWKKIPSIAGTMLVMLARRIEISTRGKAKALIHRVKRPRKNMRGGGVREIILSHR